MILDIGEKVHIIERRHFPEDLRRHLVGAVTRCTENTIRVKGRVWVFDGARGGFIQKPEERDRVVQLGERLTVNVIPPEVRLDEIRYVVTPQGGLVVSDGKKFSLDVTEFTAQR
jgi:hypothetical protein